jgi:hypothetical protein
MQEAPEQAQARFLSDIAPDLQRLGGFALYKQQPGRLAFSDGRVDSTAIEEGTIHAPLRRVFAHRIRVDFQAAGAGSRVTLRGGTTRDIRRAIGRLGEPGRWPEQTEPS